MKILLYTDADVFAGTERHILDLARALRELGEEVQIGCPRPGALAARAEGAGIAVLAIPKRGRIDRDAVRMLVPLLRARQIDIIHAHNGRTHIAAAQAVRKAGCGVCIATQHFLAPARTTRRGVGAIIARFLHERAARHTAHTIAISDAVRQAALDRHEAAPDKITTIHNGTFAPDLTGTPDAAAVRRSLELASDAPFIFCAARLEKDKDLPTLIRAMPAVRARHSAARCVIAGDGELRASLQRQIAELHLEETVTLPGFREDIPALLNACDIFVLPSKAEPFGLVLLEAMALGKAVIATDAGGPREIIGSPHNGVLVLPGNPDAVANAIHLLLANPSKRSEIGLSGQRRYLARFTAQKMAEQTVALYRRALPSDAEAPTSREVFQDT